MGFSEYLRHYRVSWLKLQMTSPQLSSYEDRSLYTTWQLSLDRIERQNALSAKLLKLWAYFDRQDVWFELLQHGSSAYHDWIQKLTEDELSFNEAVRLLCNYGIVDPDLSFHKQCGSRGYSMHSCVHSWTVSVLNKEWDESLAKLALTCIASEIPSNDEKDWWLLQRRLLQHALRHEQFITDGKVKTEGMEWTLHCLGDLYEDQGKLAEAEAMYTRALQGYEEALGPKLVSSYIPALNTMANLGNVYSMTSEKDMAKTVYTRALSGFATVQGPLSDKCRDLARRLEVLDLAPAELKIPKDASTQAVTGDSKSLVRKFLRKIRR